MSDRIPDNCVVFDTETTGFDPENGDRLVEIGAVRMTDGLPTRDTFHRYINPQRAVPDAAVKVHGLTTQFLSDKLLFSEIAKDFLSFVGDLPLVAHNAEFDAKFLNFELTKLGIDIFPATRFVDTVPIARRKFPGQKVNLDALCRKLKISLDSREKHGALIDSELLAEVCVELNGGRQSNLFGAIDNNTASSQDAVSEITQVVETHIRRATETERARHAELVAKIPNALWTRYDMASVPQEDTA